MLRFGKLKCELHVDTYVLGYDKSNNTYVCPYCGNRLNYAGHTVDHIIPRDIFRNYLVDRRFDKIRPTANDNINRLATCFSCNNYKRARLYIPLIDNNIFERMPVDWQIEFAEYFRKCFTYGLNVDNPRYFNRSDSLSYGKWIKFNNAYTRLSLLGCRAIFSYPDEINVSRFDRLVNGIGLRGHQKKWIHKGYIIKLSEHNEHIAEVLTSELLRYSDLPEKYYARYYPCKIYEDGIYLGNGCYCKSYLGNNEYEVSLYDIIDKANLITPISYEDLIKRLCILTGFNYKEYLDTILSVDAITRNTDRHFGNIYFIASNGRLKAAPIMDNGAGCLCGIKYIKPFVSDEVWNSLHARPFNIEFCKDLKYNNPMMIDAKSFLRDYGRRTVSSIPLQNAIDVITRGLNESEGKAWIQL